MEAGDGRGNNNNFDIIWCQRFDIAGSNFESLTEIRYSVKCPINPSSIP